MRTIALAMSAEFLAVILIIVVAAVLVIVGASIVELFE